jgi:hypothetical protein
MTNATIPFSSDDIRSKPQPQLRSLHDLEYSLLTSTNKTDQYLLKTAFQYSVLIRRKCAREWLKEKAAIIREKHMSKTQSLQTQLTSSLIPMWSYLKKLNKRTPMNEKIESALKEC